MDPATIASLVMSILGQGNQMQQTADTKQMYRFMQDVGRNYRLQGEADLEALGAPPKMEVPASIDKFIGLTQKAARQEMPGYSQRKGAIEQSTATGMGQLGQLGSGSDVMAGALGLLSERQRQLRDLGVQASTYRAGMENNYRNAVASRAPYEQQQFYTNEWIPYQWDRQDAQSMRQMGMNMEFGAMDMGQAAATQGANMQNQNMWYMANNPYYQNALNNMFPPQQPNPMSGGGMNPYWTGPTYNTSTGQYGY